MDYVFLNWNPIAPGSGTVDAGQSEQIAYENGPIYQSAWGAFLCSTKDFSGAEKARETEGREWGVCGGSPSSPGYIPPGSVIHTVQITSIKRWCYRNRKLASHRFRVRLVESGSLAVIHSGDLIDVNLPTGLDSALVEFGPGPERSVDAPYSDASVSWKFEFEYEITTEGGGGKAGTEWRFGGTGAPGEPSVQLKIGLTRP